MHERHENERYFFDEPTLARLTRFVGSWDAPCCICAPMLGRRLAEQGKPVTLLDIDERFADVPGFRRFDLTRPEWLGQEFGLILCDPPFFNVSFAQLFVAMRMLARNDFSQPLLISYVKRRENALLRAFADFGLEPTGFFPTYDTVEPTPKNEIEFYGNVDRGRIAELLSDPG